jgi:hypothetical protein
VPTHELSDEELIRLYGPWAGRKPADATRLFADYPGRWWVAGGWAIEAYTGATRQHGDLDLEVLRADLPLLRRHLAGRFDLWAATDGALQPLLPGDDPDGAADAVLPAGCSQVWIRAGGSQPWEYEILLMAGSHDRWEFKRDRRITRPLNEIVSDRDGVPYLRPEIQLLLKARGLRPKDQLDFDATLPLLDRASRAWLRDSLELVHPGHRWLAAL